MAHWEPYCIVLILWDCAVPCCYSSIAAVNHIWVLLLFFTDTDIQLMLAVLLCVTAYNVDLSSQLKAARQQAEVSRQELTEYKEKAARILQVEC